MTSGRISDSAEIKLSIRSKTFLPVFCFFVVVFRIKTLQTAQNQITVFVSNSTGICFVCVTMVPGQPESLSKEVCLYKTADWLKCTCQLESAWREISSCTRAGNQMADDLSAGYEELGYCF